MIDVPQITQSKEQLTAVVHLQIAKDEIQRVMAPAIQEVMATVAGQGVGVAGPVFTHHFRITPTLWDFEVGVPVKAPVAAAGRVRPGKLRATRLARTTYHGPYEGLGEGWGELKAWLSAQGYEAATDLWESYLVGPESSLGPQAWCTELNQPLVR